ncbi:alginate O-acetyltransferase AlgX-related protein [Sulfurospirillum multivorans]|uniref:AlgX/AlgJ SGNH hydrolase-like domain-containing protein n=2 Tax=Sulfurospirillum multivorans TaxID=66821 RepID=A0AA86AMD4_SULMK|nr:hypothetical protein [Sulfurospirillum multivorans]AHJ12262.1 hypothetical protein SMUL_0996 [Sulfurospirillum multivorans DSM 12446]QEH05762.1 hypothetical protein SMN_0988 [Sulfurospirillum multivorans]
MSNKKFIKYFIIVSFLIISFIPILNFIILGKEIKKENIYTLDNFEAYRNYIIYKKFNYSMNQAQVIAGKDDFLFLGNNYDNVLHKTNGIYKPTNEEINNWTNKLKDLQKWYEERGINFVIVIAPNKHSIYKEKLPNWMQYDGKTITDNIVEQSNLKDINILDLRNIISNNKKDKLLYFKTDTHWNNLGASIAYSETINYINNKFNLNLQKPNYTIKDQFGPSGDLSSFLKINTILDEKYENSYILNFENNQEVCHGNIIKNNGILEKCNNKLNPIMGINAQPQYIINKNIKDNKKLLLLCDSFGTATSELYNLTFNTIWKWHYGQINGEKLSNFVEENKPDLVIYQIVERALYNDSIVTSIPNISQISIDNINLENQIFDIKQNNYFKNEQLELDFKNENYNLNAINSDPIIILNETKANSKNVILSYEINSNVDTTFQLFYKKDNNSNYNEADSYRILLKIGNNKINLLIPSEYINNNLRVDLVSNIGNYEIKKFKIYSNK